MTKEEAIKMAKAKLECLELNASDGDEDCDNHCEDCYLNYDQGNLGEQKEWLNLLIQIAEQEQKETGKVITKYGKKWVVLDPKFKTADGRNGTLLLAANIWEELPFDEKLGNYYPKSTICQYLKGETEKLIGDEETGTVELSMTPEYSTDGEHEPYRTSGLFLLTTELYKKYRRFIPKMSKMWWTATAYSFYNYERECSDGSSYVQCVLTDGMLDRSIAYLRSIGVVPALIILPEESKPTLHSSKVFGTKNN